MQSTSRRNFLKASAAAAAAAAVGVQRLAARPISKPVGLQLYSVREMLPKDFEGTLKKLSAIGYKEVEAAGYYHKSATEFKSAMDQAGLRCVSTHHPLGDLKPNLQERIDYAKTLGLEFIICSSANVHRDGSEKGEMKLDDWRYVADQFNEIGQKVNAAGMRFGYHNHTFEFKAENGVIYYDELMKKTDPKYVVFEMDCGWVYVGGHNPVEYISRAPERFPLLHVKDFQKQADGKYTNVVLGKGAGIDYKAVFRAATGLKHYFIEQEEFSEDPMTELREDVEFMKKLSV